jgi:hypothetical protein
MKRKILIALLACATIAASSTWAFFKRNKPATDMTSSAAVLLETLDDEQRKVCQLPYDTDKRVDWHFIPKKERKGLIVRNMNDKQCKAGFALLQTALSKAGYDKSRKIMALESILAEFEGDKGRFRRDPEKYYFTVFGTPKTGERWGLSFEGHHVSLNFVVEGDEVISSTPQFFATNPGVVKNKTKTGIAVGTRVLAKEELLAFDLVRSLDDKQIAAAVIAEKAPREIRNAGSPQPPTDPPEGIAASKLNKDQRKTLHALIEEYCRAMPYDVAEQRLAAIEKAGWDKIHFAWAGATKEGIGHYYRVQGPTFLIEFVNTQPDAAGNPANHVHCVWRDMHGDFALPIKKG